MPTSGFGRGFVLCAMPPGAYFLDLRRGARQVDIAALGRVAPRAAGGSSTQTDPTDQLSGIVNAISGAWQGSGETRPLVETGMSKRMAGEVNEAVPDIGFRAAYRDLEARMKALAEADGGIYFPNPEPSGRVEYVFICMEPSLGGGWARDPDKVRAATEAGFRNFVNSIEDFLLHFSIRRYLCKANERYYITDWSKGAMPVKGAGVDRARRYDKWYPLLVEEVDLIAASDARVFAVGREVEWHLARLAFPRHITLVIHYSPLAGAARASGIVGHEDEFEQFRASVSLDVVLATAREVLNESVPPNVRDQTLGRLARQQLTESRQKLIFNYKLAFESQR
jgi:hypothetical protein